jgi:hypothetical protein
MIKVSCLAAVGLLVTVLAPAWLPSSAAQQGNICWVPADLNCDGVVNCDDIDPFTLALADPEAWQDEYPACKLINADVNGDGKIDTFDIDPFYEAISKRAITGDANCDGCIDEDDIDPFTLALTAPCDYKHQEIGAPF